MRLPLTGFVPRHLILALLALVVGLSSLSQAQTRPDTELLIDWQTRCNWQAISQPLDRAMNYCYLGMAGNTGTRVAAAVDVIKATYRTKLANQAFFKYASLPTELPVSNHPSQMTLEQRPAPQTRQFTALKRIFLDERLASITQAKDLLNQTAVYAATEIRRVSDATRQQSRKVLTQLADGVRWIAEAGASPNPVADQAYWDYYGDCDHWNIVLVPAEPDSNSALSPRGNWRVFPYRDVSNFVAAELNGLTSKLRHFTTYCIKQIEPEFLQLEFNLVEEHGPI